MPGVSVLGLLAPQYVGTVLFIWGFIVATRFPGQDWILLPTLETTYYVVGAWLEGRRPRLRAGGSLPGVHGVLLDLQGSHRVRGGHASGRIPALLDVVVGADLVLLLAGETGVFGQGIAEAGGQPIVGPAEALAEIEEASQGEAHGLENGQRLVVLVGQEVAEADLVAEAIVVTGLAQ